MKKILFLATILITMVQVGFAQSKTDAQLNQVLTSYYELKNALATDKPELAVEKVTQLASNVEAVNHQELPAAQHQLWMEQAGILKNKAAELSKSKDIKLQRKAFEGISYAMIKTVKNIKFNNNTVYVQHCPMAKASWLNEKENIENPYYGKMMFDCGDLAETIKPNK